MRKGDDLTTFIVPKVKNIRSLNLPEPLGPPRPVAGHLYLTWVLHLLFTHLPCVSQRRLDRISRPSSKDFLWCSCGSLCWMVVYLESCSGRMRFEYALGYRPFWGFSSSSCVSTSRQMQGKYISGPSWTTFSGIRTRRIELTLVLHFPSFCSCRVEPRTCKYFHIHRDVLFKIPFTHISILGGPV